MKSLIEILINYMLLGTGLYTLISILAVFTGITFAFLVVSYVVIRQKLNTQAHA